VASEAMAIYHGIVKGNVIVLPEGVQLEEGTEVEVRAPVQPDASEDLLERAFEQRLLEKGLLTEIKRPPRVPPMGDRTPIRVKGKPLSQMIIEERR
jgi:hypothetical protein